MLPVLLLGLLHELEAGEAGADAEQPGPSRSASAGRLQPPSGDEAAEPAAARGRGLRSRRTRGGGSSGGSSAARLEAVPEEAAASTAGLAALAGSSSRGSAVGEGEGEGGDLDLAAEVDAAEWGGLLPPRASPFFRWLVRPAWGGSGLVRELARGPGSRPAALRRRARKLQALPQPHASAANPPRTRAASSGPPLPRLLPGLEPRQPGAAAARRLAPPP